MQFSMMFCAKLAMLFVALMAVVGGHLAIRGTRRSSAPPQWHVPAANAERGETMIRKYGCGACHAVSGVPGATGTVGPRLDEIGKRIYIGGVLPNSPQNLVHWIQNPKEAAPRTAMPDLGVTETDARDIAAYLYSLQ